MKILSKIRERSLFLILVIGLALFAFVLDPSKLADFFNSNKVNQVGEVNGEVITRQEFAKALDSYKTATGNRVSEMQAAKYVWNNLIRNKIYESQLKEAGVTVGEADILSFLYDSPTVKNDPKFQTSGILDKNKLKEYLATVKENNGPEWKAWQNYMQNIKENLQKTTYDNLVSIGLGSTLKEGEIQYISDNTKINVDFVYYPFSSIADSLVTVKNSEIETYIKNNEQKFQVDASRDIKYAKFDIKPTNEDKIAIKNKVAKLLEDSESFGTKGLKNTTDYKSFIEENKSDLPLNENFQFKEQVPKIIADTIFKSDVGSVFGPYEDNGYYKISKIVDLTKVSDSVKSSHILIPFVGSSAAIKTTKKTEEQAKKTADSIYKLVKNNNVEFNKIANEINPDGTKGKDGSIGWVTYNSAFSPNFDKDFADFIFNNDKGIIEVVKTKFGFHIIRIDDKKEIQKALKLATFARKIEASEATENNIYQKAESFSLDLSNGNDFEKIAKQKNISLSPAQGLKALDENIPGLGKEREIVLWSFGKDLKVGDFKRFDIDGGYVVVILTQKIEKGLIPISKAITKVKPILINEKKAKIIQSKMKGSTLASISKSSGKNIRKETGLNLKSPTISGVGFEPKVVGAMLYAKKDKIYNNIIGDKGVFAFKIISKELPKELNNYNTFSKRIEKQLQNQTYNMYEAIKKVSNVEDGLSTYYGIQQ